MDFAELYRRYAPDVFRFVYYLAGNREQAEDIAAETFARALTSVASVQTGSVKAYLFAIARNLVLDAMRVQGRTRPLDAVDLDAIDRSPDPETIAAGRVDLMSVRDALQRLPEGERAALVMAAVDGLPHDQIAAALGCSAAAVKVRVHRARLRLRLLLGQRSRS